MYLLWVLLLEMFFCFNIKHLLRPEVELNRILMVKSKIDRAKSKVKDFNGILHLEEKSKAVRIGVYRKIDDKTFDYNTYEDENRYSLLKKVTASEHHLTFTYESGFSSGEYLTHRTLPMVNCPGEMMAQHVFDILSDYDSLESIKALLVDNTSVKTR